MNRTKLIKMNNTLYIIFDNTFPEVSKEKIGYKECGNMLSENAVKNLFLNISNYFLEKR